MAKVIFTLIGFGSCIGGLGVLVVSPTSSTAYFLLGIGLLLISYRFSLSQSVESEDTSDTLKKGRFFSGLGLFFLIIAAVFQVALGVL